MKTDESYPGKGMKYEGRGLELYVFRGCNMYATADHNGFTVCLCTFFDVSIIGMVRSNPAQTWVHIGLQSIFVLSRAGRGFAIGRSLIPGVLTAIGNIHNPKS